MTPNNIILGKDMSEELLKFVFSAGMSRSVQLASLENLLDIHLSKNKYIPITRAKMLQNLGGIYIYNI